MILATGAAGMTGSYLTEVYHPEQLYLTDVRASNGIAAMDIRSRDSVMETIGRIKPKLVIHLAAETNVDLCEQEDAHAFETNLAGTLNIALACRHYGTDLAYVSTAGVFDGTKGAPYTELDAPNPINTYAKSKLEGEKIVQSLVPHSFVARAGWMFGGSRRDRKFVGKIAAQCLEGGENVHLKAVSDKTGSPTYARDFIAQLRILTESHQYGLYHLVNAGCATRYDVAVEIASILGVPARIEAVSSDAFPLPAQRPNSEAAINHRLNLVDLNQMRAWQEALRDYLKVWMTENNGLAFSAAAH